MATVTGNQAASGIIPVNHGLAFTTKTIFGVHALTANVTAADIYRLCKIPGHSFVVGGEFIVSDMDTGTETLDIDLGWEVSGASGDTFTDAAGVVWSNSGATADPDGFVNSGVLTGDAITDLVAAGSSRRPIVLATGPLYFAKDTYCSATVVAAAATFAAGTMWAKLQIVLAG